MQDWQAEISITMLKMAEHKIDICRRVAASQAAQSTTNTPEPTNMPLHSHGEEQAGTGVMVAKVARGDNDCDIDLQDNALHNGNGRLQGNTLQSGQGEQGPLVFLHTPQEPNRHTPLQALPAHTHRGGLLNPAPGLRRQRCAGLGTSSSQASPMGLRPSSLPKLARSSTPNCQDQASSSAQRPQQQATTAGMTQFPAASANRGLRLSFGEEQSQYNPTTSETSRGTVGY
ncbi:hypothetical protein FRC12_010328 [Ceratobasidium sp. 428]|nr:hypothetical protein FRC12_010328 [Ceratobasidium sp. 428]